MPTKEEAYRQAAAWLLMINSATWTVASIFLAGSFAIMGIALGLDATGKGRILLAILGIVLIVAWWKIDQAYSHSARATREYLASLEGDEKFFSNQTAHEMRPRGEVDKWLRRFAVCLLAGWVLAATPAAIHHVCRWVPCGDVKCAVVNPIAERTAAAERRRLSP